MTLLTVRSNKSVSKKCAVLGNVCWGLILAALCGSCIVLPLNIESTTANRKSYQSEIVTPNRLGLTNRYKSAFQIPRMGDSNFLKSRWPPATLTRPILNPIYQRNFQMKVIGTLLTTLILVACGGGGSTGETPITGTLSGTAAVGSPIVGASVRVICVGGSTLTSQVTSSLGLWQVSLRGQTFPCAAQVSGGTINGVANTLSLHAIAFDAGTLNITPLTDLVVANATQSAVPGDWFAALNAAGLVSLKEAKLNDTSTLLIDVLGVGYFYDPNHTINPFTTPFAPVSGDTMDDTLTALKGAVSNLGTTYPAFLSDVSVVTGYSPSFDNIATAVHMNFRETVSGRIMFNLSEPIGPNGTGNNTTTGLALNGTPNIDLTKCVASADAFNYEKCQANSIADFGPLKIVNAADGETCTASYVNGVLTVSKGSLSITGYMNGGSMSNILIWGADPVLPVAMIDAYASAGTIMQRPWVSWSDNGALGFIGGFLLNAVGTNTEFTCQSFL